MHTIRFLQFHALETDIQRLEKVCSLRFSNIVLALTESLTIIFIRYLYSRRGSRRSRSRSRTPPPPPPRRRSRDRRRSRSRDRKGRY